MPKTVTADIVYLPVMHAMPNRNASVCIVTVLRAEGDLEDQMGAGNLLHQTVDPKHPFI